MMRLTLVSLAAAAFVLAGCSDRSQAPLAPATPRGPVHALAGTIDVNGLLQFIGTPDLTGTRHAEKFIRASQGGFVELNGFRVDVAAGALPYDATVTIDLPGDAVLAKRVMAEFGPHGIQFKKPVTISFPLEGVILPARGGIEVARWESNAWTSLGGWVSADGKRLFSTTPHFSTYSGHVMAGG